MLYELQPMVEISQCNHLLYTKYFLTQLESQCMLIEKQGAQERWISTLSAS